MRRRRLSKKKNILIRKILILAVLLIAITVLLTSCNKNTDENNVEEVVESTESVAEGVVYSKVYFPDHENTYLYMELKYINKATVEEAVSKVFDELKTGPEQEKLYAIISEDVNVLSVKIEENICTVDLSSGFITSNSDSSRKEMMALYSIVNSICALPGIDQVKINVEGNECATLGEYTLKDNFEADQNIVF